MFFFGFLFLHPFLTFSAQRQINVENNYISAKWIIEQDTFKPKSFLNKKIQPNVELIPLSQSEEFIIAYSASSQDEISFLKSSSLKFDKIEEVQNQKRIIFQTYQNENVEFDIVEVIELNEGQSHLDKYIEIKCNSESVNIHYIDFNNYVYSKDDIVKSCSYYENNNLVSTFSHPIYINSFYTGSFSQNSQGTIEKSSQQSRIRFTLQKQLSNRWFATDKLFFGVDSESLSNRICKLPNDDEPFAVEIVKTTKETQLIARFNKLLKPISTSSFSIEGLNIVSTSLGYDERTVTLNTDPMVNYTSYKLSIKGVKDLSDEEITTTVDFKYYAHNIISSLRGTFSGSDSAMTDEQISLDSFTIRINVNDYKSVKGQVLLHSENNQVVIEITSDNKFKFTVGSLSVTSSSAIDDKTKVITFVRERNAYIKIYYDDEIVAYDWDKTMQTTVSIQKLLLNKNSVVYNSIKVYNYGFSSNEVSKEISLKNQYIERVFNIANDKVTTAEIVNYRTDEYITLIPEEGSEEFVFSIANYFNTPVEDVYRLKNIKPTPIDRSQWHIVETKAIASNKYQITFDLGQIHTVKSFSLNSKSANIYKVCVANTISQLNELVSSKQYDAIVRSSFDNLVYANFTTEQTGRYVSFISNEFDFCDFNLYAEFADIKYVDISSSEFTLDSYKLDQTAESQKIQFVYKPYIFNRIHYNVVVVYELLKDKHYIEKLITIQIPKEEQSLAKIDYLDLDRLYISNADKQQSWTHPVVEPKRGDLLSKYIIELGQPVYVNSFFLGCRFGFADTQIGEGNLVINRYQSGKNFSQLKQNDQGVYTCWKTVIGTSRSVNIPVVRSDFFSYIDDISIVNKLRIQYNSWYDWMLTITESNILSSFKEIEKGCTQHGLKPLDSYVIDDGWNNYNTAKYHVHDEPKSGTTDNEDGFWTMNSKFPDGFTRPSEFSHLVSSNFGVWLGPRGGYNYQNALAHIIEDAGNGYYNAQGGDIDVASIKYTSKLSDFLNDWINQYKVNYYKLDGWLLRPCTNANHDHMVGGYDNVYEFTDYWERYVAVFERLRETAESNNIFNLWLSLTCYINPSPFHLQYANSIWVQISNDVGYTHITSKDSKADEMLNYRDNVYYEFYNTYQFQYPQQSIYNHDPIYGQTGTPLKGSLDDNEFRRYLFMCGMRGTSFFELYYTYSMIDEGDKWYVNAEVLKYIQERHEVLRHSQLFGGHPEKGEVYGFSCWSTDRGTIALRNPSDSVKEFTFTLNRDINVPENIPTLYRKTVLDFNTIEDLQEGKEQHYNDEIKVNLQPRETRIIDFEPTQDKDAAKVEVVKCLNDTEIQIRFDKKVRFDVSNYQIDHDMKIKEGKLRGDLRTVSLYTETSFANTTEYTITLTNVKDSIGNVLNTDVKYTYMSNNLIADINNEIGPLDKDTSISSIDHSVEAFTIQLNVKEMTVENVVLIRDTQNKISVEIADKKIKFTVGDVSVSTKEDIAASDVKITCVRERNTMLKIYINQDLDNSAYQSGINEIMNVKNVELCKAKATYSSIKVASYGFTYKDVENNSINQIRNEVDTQIKVQVDNKYIVIPMIFITVFVVAAAIFIVKKKKQEKENINDQPLIDQ